MLIDDQTFTLLKTAIKKDGWLVLPAYGNSMFPFIQHGNVCRFVSCEPSLLKKGEVILFYSQTNQLIAHRIVGIKRINSHPLYLLKGDTNLGFDQPIEEGRILGKLVSVEKRRINITPEHLITRAWGRLILTFPVISGILRQFLNWKFKLQY